MKNTLLFFVLLMIFGCTNNRDNLFKGVIDDTHLGKGCNYGSSLADATELCDVYRGNKFASNNNAEIALNKILSVTGMSKRYVLQECTDISNCVATSYKGIRYILYDPEFMDIIATHTNPWSRLAILAHEIGHHVNGHSLDLLVYASKSAEAPTLSESRQMELEADEFSGFVMYKLGASLSQAQEAIKLISTNNDDAYSTHPAKDKRLLAIARGYNNAKKQDANNTRAPQSKETQKEDISLVTNDKDINDSEMNAEDYFYLAKSLTQSNKEYAEILDFVKEKVFTDQECYSFTNDYYESSQDFSANKEYKEKSHHLSFYWSGKFNTHENLSQKQLNYYNTAIELDPYFIEAYYERALIHFLNKDQYEGNSIYKCIKDLNKTLELNPNHIDALILRHSSFLFVPPADENQRLNHEANKPISSTSALRDIKKLLKIKPEFTIYLTESMAFCYGHQSKWKKTQQCWDLLINMFESNNMTPPDWYYRSRATMKELQGLNPCSDLSKACDIATFHCKEYYRACN